MKLLSPGPGLAIVLAVLFSALTIRTVEATPVDGSDDAVRSPLRVLYVGPDPTKPPKVPSHVTGVDAERMPELMTERMPAFEAFLGKHFESVRVVNADDYEPAMSDECDVTIFDARPRVVSTRKVGDWDKKLRLPDDFYRPALMVGEVGPLTLGRFGFDLLLDHL